jgi:uncharacterized protein YjbI with pentapeptide repeats/energy-coupling factor transporter ATP-binding protein EcfA2
MVRDALVVGINNYQAEGLRNLQAPAEDAEAIACILEEHGEFKVTRLPEALTRDAKQPYVSKQISVSLAQLEDALIQLFHPQGRNIPDTALFYFSGHGIRRTSGLTEGFLPTSDVALNQRFYGLSLQWLRRLLQESPIRQQIIWLDCCHSGELLNFNEANPGDAGAARDRCFIAASREFEKAYEDLDSDYSVLTKVLLTGLDPSRCPQQWVTNISLVDFIDKNFNNATQRPIYSNFGGAIALTRTFTVTGTNDKPRTTSEICPYKGLEYFDCADADYFYGREELTDTLLNRIRENNFLAILGASGSGKSSVLRAGLIHQLQLGHKLANSKDWQILITVPTEHPLKRLAELFVDSNASQLDKAEQLGKAEKLLTEGAEGLRKLIQTSEASRVVLILDQFEEVFTLCQNPEERAKFFQCILEALATTENKLCLILTMRVDFFGKCLEKDYSGLGKKIEDNLIAISPMTEVQLEDAIVKPAHRVNLVVETELVGEILGDVQNSPGVLPLLQYTLTEIWKRKTDHRLQLTTYINLGRIGGTLDRRATEVFNTFNQRERETVKHIFMSLTHLGEGTEDTRRRVFKRDLITNKHPELAIDLAIKKLADEKLIVTGDRVAQDSQLSREAVVDVAHEALIRNWELLGKWLDESRSNLLKQRKIEDDARSWQNSGKKSDYLLQGSRLKEARKFQRELGEKYSLSILAEAFIKKSIKKQNKDYFKLLMTVLGITWIIGFLVYQLYQQISIPTAWNTLKEAEKDENPYRKNEALKTLNYWQALKQANLQGMNLQKIMLYSADLSSADLTGADLTGAKLSSAKLSSAKLSSANLRLADLYSANLYSANLYSADLSSADLTGADLTGADLYSANLYSADLTGADLTGADLYSANLYSAKLSSANLNSANLNSANLSSADLSLANLYSAGLSSAKLNSANLRLADLTGADLTGADLTGADLNSADLSSAKLSSADLNSANLTDIKKLTNSQIKSACFWGRAIYRIDWNEKQGKWVINPKKNQQRIAEITNDKSSDPKTPPDCSRWK